MSITDEDILGAKIIEVDSFSTSKIEYGTEYLIIEKNGIKYKVTALWKDDWNPLDIEKIEEK